MNSRPWELVGLSGLLVLVALGFPAQIIWMFDLGLSEVAEVWTFLTPMNFVCIGSILFSAGLVLQVSRHSLWSVPLSIGIVTLNNYEVGVTGWNYSSESALFGTLAFGMIHFTMLTTRVRNLLKNPSHRWWLRLPRSRVAVPAFLDPIEGRSVRTRTFDLNEKGVFLAWEDPQSQRLRVADRVEVSLTLGTLQPIRCQAKIVRVQDQPIQGSYPAGYGLAFEGLDRRERKALRNFTRKIHMECPIH